jgi:EmrB/QacA subfamily drug resistance transporter
MARIQAAAGPLSAQKQRRPIEAASSAVPHATAAAATFQRRTALSHDHIRTIRTPSACPRRADRCIRNPEQIMVAVTMAETTADRRFTTRSRSALVLLTMCLGVLVAQIDTSVVNLALKRLGEDLSADVSVLQWVIDAYNLTYASLLLTGGTLADLYGRRRIFMLGIVLFTAGSLLCGFAPNAATLIAGRTIAGAGAALEVPTTLAILTVAYPDPAERAKPLGLWASCNGIAFIIGPTLGGLLVDHAGWRSIFLLIVPLCVLALGLAVAVVRESSAAQGRHLDPSGQTLGILALGSLALGVIEGPHWGWLSPWTGATALTFAVSLAAFLAVEAHTRGAMIPLELFRSRPLSASLAMASLMTFGMYAMLFLTPLYLQTIHGASALRAGLALLPMSLAFVIVAQLSGRLTQATGARVMTCGGMAGMGIGMVLFALTAGHGLWASEAALLVIGVGLGLITAPVQNIAVASVPAARAGTASGLVNTARMVGAALGVAVLGMLFATGAGVTPDAASFRLPYLVGGFAELIGMALALAFIRDDTLAKKA